MRPQPDSKDEILTRIRFITGLLAGLLLSILLAWLYLTKVIFQVPTYVFPLIILVVAWSVGNTKVRVKKGRAEKIVVLASILAILGIPFYEGEGGDVLNLSLVFAVSYFVISAFLDLIKVGVTVALSVPAFVMFTALMVWWWAREERALLLVLFSLVFTVIVIWILGDMVMSKAQPHHASR